MEPVDLNLSREILYSTLGKIIISKSFQLSESDIYISNRSLEIVHGIIFPSNKREKRIKFSDAGESYKEKISRLLDLDQIKDILQPSLASIGDMGPDCLSALWPISDARPTEADKLRLNPEVSFLDAETAG